MKYKKGTKVQGEDVNTELIKSGLYIRETLGKKNISMISINGKKGFVKNAEELRWNLKITLIRNTEKST